MRNPWNRYGSRRRETKDVKEELYCTYYKKKKNSRIDSEPRNGAQERVRAWVVDEKSAKHERL